MLGRTSRDKINACRHYRLLLSATLLMVVSVATAENDLAQEIAPANGTPANHVSVWAAPKSADLTKVLHQVATDLRFKENITVNFNLFMGYRMKHYLVDVYPDLLAAKEEGRLPDAAILPLDEALSLKRHVDIAPLPPSAVPEAKLAPELLSVAKLDGNYIGVPLFDGNHFVLYSNKNLLKTLPKHWRDTKTLERMSEAIGIHAITWQASCTQAFCSLMQCNAGDDLRTMEVKLANYRALVREFELPMQCLAECEDSLCEYKCVHTQFRDEKAAMMLSGGWAIPEFSNAISHKLAISALPALYEGNARPPRYPTVLVFFGEPLSEERRSVTKALITQFTRGIHQKGMYYSSGRLPAHQKMRARFLSQMTEESESLLDYNLHLQEQGYETPLAGSNYFHRDFDAVLKKVLVLDYDIGDAAKLYFQFKDATEERVE